MGLTTKRPSSRQRLGQRREAAAQTELAFVSVTSAADARPPAQPVVVSLRLDDPSVHRPEVPGFPVDSDLDAGDSGEADERASDLRDHAYTRTEGRLFALAPLSRRKTSEVHDGEDSPAPPEC